METVGLILDAQGADKYLQTLGQVAAAETKVAAAADPAVAGINALDDKADAAAKSTRAMSMIIEEATGNITIFGDEADQTAADAAALGKSADKAGAGVDDLGGAARKGGKGVDQLGEDAEKSSKQVSLLDKITTGAAERIGHLLTDAAAEAGRAVLKFVGDSIGAAGDFEAGMNNFAATVGDSLADSGQSVEDFKDLFLSLGQELPVSTSEVQQAAIELSKGGIEPATIAAGGLRQTLQFAAASGLGLAEAAEVAAKAVGGWTDVNATAAQKAAFLAHSTDLLARAANASSSDVDELALGLYNSQGAAKAAGASFDEVVTTLAVTATAFGSSAQAGTGLANFMNRLQPQTKDATAAFKELNLLTAEGKSVFYDAAGSFVGMSKASAILQGAFKDLTEAERAEKMQTIFGNDAKNTAIKLAEVGAEGYDAMTEAMAKQLSVAALAERKQKGYNAALDNLGGSLEALQITIASDVLPALTDLVNLTAKGINAITAYAKATVAGETALAKFAGIVHDVFLPALTGVTTALLAYATVQVATAAPAAMALIAKVNLATAAFYANAASVAAAMLPYALIAAAIGGVVYAYQNFTDKVSTATQELLNSRQWWNDSAAAVENYASQTSEAKEALEPYVTTIGILRDQIEAEIDSLAKRDAAGLVSDEQRQSEMDHINLLRENLTSVTNSYNEQEQALLSNAAAGVTASSVTTTLTDRIDALGDRVVLTKDELEKLTQATLDNAKKGQEAVQAYATTYSEFAGGIEDRASKHKDQIASLEEQKQKATTAEQKKGIADQIAQVEQNYRDQESAAALSYARQAQAQKQHLGQMLLDYTVNQAELGNISKAKAAEITSGIEKEYGLQESSVATTYLKMTDSIDKFATDAGGDIDALIGDLRDQQHQAADTQKAMDAYAKEYTAKQTNNFLDGKQDAETYIRSLESIPTEINTTVTTTYRERHDERGDDPSQQSPGRASGGSVDAGMRYLVGENGPEYFTPTTSGYITPTDAIQRAMPSLAQLGAKMGGNTYNAPTIINVDARGSSLTMADVARGVQAGLRAEGRNADVQIRTGAF